MLQIELKTNVHIKRETIIEIIRANPIINNKETLCNEITIALDGVISREINRFLTAFHHGVKPITTGEATEIVNKMFSGIESGAKILEMNRNENSQEY